MVKQVKAPAKECKTKTGATGSKEQGAKVPVLAPELAPVVSPGALAGMLGYMKYHSKKGDEKCQMALDSYKGLDKAGKHAFIAEYEALNKGKQNKDMQFVFRYQKVKKEVETESICQVEDMLASAILACSIL